MIELNLAVAIGKAHGAARALLLADSIRGLDAYHLLHSTRAHFLRELGREEEARTAYKQALELAPSEVERAFLRERLEG